MCDYFHLSVISSLLVCVLLSVDAVSQREMELTMVTTHHLTLEHKIEHNNP